MGACVFVATAWAGTFFFCAQPPMWSGRPRANSRSRRFALIYKALARARSSFPSLSHIHAYTNASQQTTQPQQPNARLSSTIATMQWLVTFYCALMGAVQYYTLIPVGCDLAFNSCHPNTNTNTVPVYTLATIASAPWMPKVPLLDAAPVPLLIDGVPTCTPPPAPVSAPMFNVDTTDLHNKLRKSLATARNGMALALQQSVRDSPFLFARWSLNPFSVCQLTTAIRVSVHGQAAVSTYLHETWHSRPVSMFRETLKERSLSMCSHSLMYLSEKWQARPRPAWSSIGVLAFALWFFFSDVSSLSIGRLVLWAILKDSFLVFRAQKQKGTGEEGRACYTRQSFSLFCLESR